MFSNVIVGVDGYDGGRDALALAASLSPARLTLVGVYPHDPLPLRGGPPGYEHMLRDDVQRMLEAAAAAAGVDAELSPVGDQSAARALHREAERLGADLIVIGSAHHGPVGRLLLGDVGRAVLHDAPCPVAVAPKQAGSATPRTVAVGFDGSPESRAALNLAEQLAQEHAAALTLIVVWEDPPLPIAEAAMVYDLAQMKADRAKWADTLLAETLAAMPASVAGRVLHGRPAVVLADQAESFDLLLVGSRCWGPVKRVALGSTADRLVHRLPCPVIVVPRPGGAEETHDDADQADVMPAAG